MCLRMALRAEDTSRTTQTTKQPCVKRRIMGLKMCVAILDVATHAAASLGERSFALNGVFSSG